MDKNKEFTLAVGQFAVHLARRDNIDQALACLEEAGKRGAEACLLPELFEFPYFPISCGHKEYRYWASSAEDHPYIRLFQAKAKHFRMGIALSFLERAALGRKEQFYNSLAWINAEGELSKIYRKTHLPHGTGYEEDKYFTAGTTLPALWAAPGAVVGAGICWDQWFVEPARLAALSGADLLLYPSAIGTEPVSSTQRWQSTPAHWQRVMCGHAAANILPVAAANRTGTEISPDEEISITFYGSSFIAGPTGEIVAQFDQTTEGTLTETFDLAEIARFRADWGVLTDRRPELYGDLLTPPPTK